MPSRALTICTHCGQAHTGDCAGKAAARAERKAKADKNRPNARQRGYDHEWERARAEYLLAYPSCRRCGAKAALVDHIVPISVAPHRRLDRTNFQSLCTPCHSSWKQQQDRKGTP